MRLRENIKSEAETEQDPTRRPPRLSSAAFEGEGKSETTATLMLLSTRAGARSAGGSPVHERVSAKASCLNHVLSRKTLELIRTALPSAFCLVPSAFCLHAPLYGLTNSTGITYIFTRTDVRTSYSKRIYRNNY